MTIGDENDPLTIGSKLDASPSHWRTIDLEGGEWCLHGEEEEEEKVEEEEEEEEEDDDERVKKMEIEEEEEESGGDEEEGERRGGGGGEEEGESIRHNIPCRMCACRRGLRYCHRMQLQSQRMTDHML